MNPQTMQYLKAGKCRKMAGWQENGLKNLKKIF